MIKLIVIDVDGTLTDGKVYIDKNGEVFKAFNIKDGYGIRKAIDAGIKILIITGRYSSALEYRVTELGIQHLYQGVKDKNVCLNSFLCKHGISACEVACIGDDENDLDIIKVCGYSGCPLDAVRRVKQACNFVSSTVGGNGAVREFIESVLERNLDDC